MSCGQMPFMSIRPSFGLQFALDLIVVNGRGFDLKTIYDVRLFLFNIYRVDGTGEGNGSGV